MTSLAFILGVVPLYIASGASAASQKAIGTGVFWGMLIGTPLSVFLVPVFFVVIFKLFGKKEKQDLAPQGATSTSSVANAHGGSNHE